MFQNFIEAIGAISQNLQSVLPRNDQNANKPDGNEIDGLPLEPTEFNSLEPQNDFKRLLKNAGDFVNKHIAGTNETGRDYLRPSEIERYSYVHPNEQYEREPGVVQGLDESSDNIRHSMPLSAYIKDKPSEPNTRKLIWRKDLGDDDPMPDPISNSHAPDQSDESFIEDAELEGRLTDVHFNHPYSAEGAERAFERHEGVIQGQRARGQKQTDSHPVDTNQINNHARGEIESLGTNIDQQVKQNAVQEIRPGIDRELNKIGTNAAEAIDDGIQAGEDQIFNAEDTAENVALE